MYQPPAALIAPAAAAASSRSSSSSARPHSLSHPNGIKLHEALGYDRLYSLKKSLETLGVTNADREQAYYPRILGWLDNGLEDGTMIIAADVVTAADELAVKKDRRGNVLNALHAFIRQRALRRAAREESDRDTERRARQRHERQDAGDPARVTATVTLPRQPAPPQFDGWAHTAARLASELRSIGRSPRDLPIDPLDWPETYLP